MTNYDYYKDVILKLYNNNYKITSEGKIEQCNVKYGDGCNCTECIFNDRFFKCCSLDTKIRWLFKEYKPLLSKKEKAFLEMLETEIWLVRDANNLLFGYFQAPTKNLKDEVWTVGCEPYYCIKIKDEYFSFIRWEDKEPMKVSDILKYFTLE